MSERVLDALFNGRVADGLCGVSGVVGQALVASEDGGSLVLDNTPGNDATIVEKRVGEFAGQTS